MNKVKTSILIRLLKERRSDAAAIILFIGISFLYFFPAVIENRVIAQHDNIAFIGAGQEVLEYKEKTGETSRWTNSLFGGMPTYQTSPSYQSGTTLKFLEKIYQLFLPNYVFLVFIMLTGFYILMRVLNLSVWLSILGAVIWAFSSYFFIIITAGHIWKFITLAYIPPTIAGMIVTYRGKYLMGGLLVAFFFALQVMSNHIQMTYYFLPVLILLGLSFLIEAIKTNKILHFIKATAVLCIAFMIGASINISNLYHTYEYSKDTMRGKPELVKKSNIDNQTGSGLERSYITQWSYGIGETFSLLIPNVKGGASTPLANNEKAMTKANPQFRDVYKQIPQYWGEQPGTSGPVYVGAFVCMLFLLGCFIVKGPIKWALVAATLLSILLSWGKNFMPLTDFFIDYIPLYSKFRTVASILVVAEFTIPLLAILALKELIQRPTLLKEKSTYLYISIGLTGGISLLFALMPQLFFSSFISSELLAAIQTSIPPEVQSTLIDDLTAINISIFAADAWRSFFIITLGVIILWIYANNKLKPTNALIFIIILCMADMWSVNKRYLNDSHFEPADNKMKAVQKSPADEIILQDTTLNYRVLNLASNTFNENNTSYWHKSVGGYHAAKMRRYQEMIEYYISPEMGYLMQGLMEHQGDINQVNGDSLKVLNMLNTKYFILPTQAGTFPIENPYAYGNAWFIQNIRYVETANQEIEEIKKINPLQEAVVNTKYQSALNNLQRLPKDTTAEISLIEYAPNKIKYHLKASREQVVVFSEVFHKQWKAYIDEQEVPIACVDYILRAIKTPAGTHIVELRFDPESIRVTETIAYVAQILLLVAFIILIWRRYKKM